MEYVTKTAKGMCGTISKTVECSDINLRAVM